MNIPITEVPTLWVQDGDTFYCKHVDITTEVVEIDYMKDGEHDTYETTIEVCTDCDEEIA